MKLIRAFAIQPLLLRPFIAGLVFALISAVLFGYLAGINEDSPDPGFFDIFFVAVPAVFFAYGSIVSWRLGYYFGTVLLKGDISKQELSSMTYAELNKWVERNSRSED